MSPEIEELELELSVTKKPRDRVDLQLRIALLLHYDDPPRALGFATDALKAARELNDTARIALAHRYVGLCRVDNGELERALDSLEKSIALFESLSQENEAAPVIYTYAVAHFRLNDYPATLDLLRRCIELTQRHGLAQLEAQAENLAGSVFNEVGDPTRALEHFYRSHELAERAGSLRDAAFALNNIGTIYDLLGQPERELECYRRALELSIAQGDLPQILVCRINVAMVLRGQGDLDGAEREFRAAHELLPATTYRPHQAALLREFAVLEGMRGRPGAARELLDRAVEIVDQSEGNLERSAVYEVMASHCLDNGEPHAAIDYASRALGLALEFEERFREVAARQLLARAYEAIGDLASALAEERRHAALRAEVMGAEQGRKLQEMQMRNEIEQAEREREILRLRSEQLEMTVEHKTKELTSMALHLVEKNRFLESLREELASASKLEPAGTRESVKSLMRRVESNIGSESDWRAFEEQFSLIHHDFIRNLSSRYPELTPAELKVCALVKINLSSKEIAAILSTSPKTVDLHRHKIRKKLGLPPESNLGSFIAGL